MRIPWQGKIALKLLLARLPIKYQSWSKIGIFKHGAMKEPKYALQVFTTHFERARSLLATDKRLVGLELGPGDSLSGAILGASFGLDRVLLVDVGRFAANTFSTYDALIQFLSSRDIPMERYSGCSTLHELLSSSNAAYLTGGLQDLQNIPDGSVDFVWSQAVLEHIRRAEFLPTMRELRRVLARGGVASHRIDLADHLGGALNNLRFRRQLWESATWSSSGFYTNRIRYREMLDLFHEAGFASDVVHTDRWKELPTPLRKLDREFRDKPGEDLLVSGFDVILTHRRRSETLPDSAPQISR
jgi:SAM-dependent methyltransferase